MNFVEMRDKMLAHFASMTEGTSQLFEVDVDKDKGNTERTLKVTF